MRIVQVSVGSARMPTSESHAPLQVVLNISRQLARMGHKVAIVDRKYSKHDPDVEHIEGFEIVRLKATQIHFGKAPGFIRVILAELNAVLFALAVSRYLREKSSDIDIIHFHLTSIGLVASSLNPKLRRRMVYTCHLNQWAFVSDRPSVLVRIYLLLDSCLMRQVSRVIALNDDAKESFVSVGRVKEDSVVVVPNGVDTVFFGPHIEIEETVAKSYGIEGKVIVLFVGRVAKTKGVEYLVKAADVIVNARGYRDTQFVFVGSYTYAGVDQPVNMEEMLNYIRQRQLDRNIAFTGPVPLNEVRAFYSACDIFVLPSLAEGDALVVLEAMAAGKPIIGTKVGGVPRKVRDGWNGFLVDPGDPQQLADRILYLIDNPRERHRMGANSRNYAEEEFDWGKVAERLIEVYQS